MQFGTFKPSIITILSNRFCHEVSGPSKWVVPWNSLFRSKWSASKVNYSPSCNPCPARPTQLLSQPMFQQVKKKCSNLICLCANCVSYRCCIFHALTYPQPDSFNDWTKQESKRFRGIFYTCVLPNMHEVG